MVHVGISGYSFRDWVGPFYPPHPGLGFMSPGECAILLFQQVSGRNPHRAQDNTSYWRCRHREDTPYW